ncbi:hypothetical protein Tco_0086189 [Tanacetum coccineum]
MNARHQGGEVWCLNRFHGKDAAESLKANDHAYLLNETLIGFSTVKVNLLAIGWIVDMMKAGLLMGNNMADQDVKEAAWCGETYDKVFNHLDMLHAPLEGKHGLEQDVEDFIMLKKFQQVQRKSQVKGKIVSFMKDQI